ncbi:hypothetical protein E5358_04750 [Palleniella muris]|uniref:Uncharacterized protein n=1 Tax=Palleniella muris TaxID=3038145 RepID=A0AC61QS29_9BACT|nr:hypothetical protein [Palleniella muris]TGX82973.1 hypothetical protein E5358_04750 [Palleniella muris]
MTLGTHNSLTSYPLVWYLRPFGALINIVCRCQRKGYTIEQQYNDGIRWFNLQVTKRGGKWCGSHGIALYDVTLDNVLAFLDNAARKDKETVFVQLVNDRNFRHSASPLEFDILVSRVRLLYGNLKLQVVWDEANGGKYDTRIPISGKEVYWATWWVKEKMKDARFPWWLGFVKYPPFLRYWAKRYNKRYIKEFGNYDYLMLDYVHVEPENNYPKWQKSQTLTAYPHYGEKSSRPSTQKESWKTC